MSKSTTEVFSDPEAARLHLEARRWPNGPTCPACHETKRIYAKKGDFYRCNACLIEFTVRTGTVFAKSKVPLNKWLHAIRLIDEGIGSTSLAQQIGVTQKTAWLMLDRLRNDPPAPWAYSQRIGQA